MKRFFISLMMLMAVTWALSVSNAGTALAQGPLPVNPIVEVAVGKGTYNPDPQNYINPCPNWQTIPWEVIATNLNEGGNVSEFHLCVRRSASEPPITQLYFVSFIKIPPVTVLGVKVDPPDFGTKNCNSGDTPINTNVNPGHLAGIKIKVLGITLDLTLPQEDYFCYRKGSGSALVDVQFVKIPNSLDKWTRQDPPFPITNFNGGGTPLYPFTRNASQLTKLGCGGEGEKPCSIDTSFWRQNGNFIYFGCDRGLKLHFDFDNTKCINFTRHRPDNVINFFDKTWAGWALANQEEQLNLDEPFNWVMRIKTHGSFNTRSDGYIDPNQYYSVSDQLEGGVRIVDMDLGFVQGALRVCHGDPDGEVILGFTQCTNTDRLYFNFIKEIGAWLDHNPDEVIYVKLDNLRGPEPPPTTLSNPIRLYLGHLGACTDADPPGMGQYRWPTRREMLAAGQRVIVSKELAGSTPPSCKIPASGFSEPAVHTTCPEAIRAKANTWEDRTVISSFLDTPAEPIFNHPDVYPGMYTGDDVRAWARCNQAQVSVEPNDSLRASISFDMVHAADKTNDIGVSVCKMGAIHRLIEERRLTDSVWPSVAGKFDPILPIYSVPAWDNALAALNDQGQTDLNNRLHDLCPNPDNRLKQAVWSWRENDFGQNGDAALFNQSDGRWASANPDGEHHFACAKPRFGPPETWPDPIGETWKITDAKGPWFAGFETCQKEFGADGLVFSVPVNGWQNEKLKEAANAAGEVDTIIWLNYRKIRTSGEWAIIGGPPEVTIISPLSPFPPNQASLFSADVSGTGGDSGSYLWDFGDGATSTEIHPFHSYAAEGEYTVQLTVTSHGLTGTDTHTVHVEQGGFFVPVPKSILVTTLGPSNEGVTVIANAVFEDLVVDTDLLNDYSCTVDYGDGSDPVDGTVEHNLVILSTYQFICSGPPQRTYADNGTYTVAITLNDPAPLPPEPQSSTNWADLTVNNVAPTVEAGADQEVVEGENLLLDPATFNDPGTADTHKATIDWGDGTPLQKRDVTETPFGPPGDPAGANGTVDASHAYAEKGEYDVKVCVEDDEEAETCDSLKVTVTNAVPPTVNLPAIDPEPSDEGSSVIASAIFSDLSNFVTQCKVNYGDGSQAKVGTIVGNTCIGQAYAYADNGSYPVVVIVSDTDENVVVPSAPASLLVNNVAPMVDPPTIDPEPSGEGSSVIARAIFSDPGAGDTHTCTVDYGDGNGPEDGTVEGETCTGPDHTYANRGDYEVTVAVMDDDGASADGRGPHTVVGPTAITLASFGAASGPDGVTVRWETGTEIDNAGFNLHRAKAKDGPYTKVNEVLLPAKGDPVSGASYVYLDSGLNEDVIYYYKLEDIDFNGVSTFHGPVSTAYGITGGPAPDGQIYLPLLLKEQED